jgi:GTP cyclohydrolase II
LIGADDIVVINKLHAGTGPGPKVLQEIVVSIKFVVSSRLPTPWATFEIHCFEDAASGKEHLVVSLGNVSGETPVLCRVHSECMTGDALFSLRCDCGAQLQSALQKIAAEGRGALLYLRQEGRGIGLSNKIRAYQLQDEGADTVEANEALGFGADLRNYDICREMLAHFGISSVRLMTNNPRKVDALSGMGIVVAERIPLQSGLNPHNAQYLATKTAKLGHLMDSQDPTIEPPAKTKRPATS